MYLSIPIVLPCDCSSPKNKTLWLLLGLPHYEATTLKPVTRDATWMWRVPLSVPLLRSVRRVAAPGCRKMLVACNNDNSVPFRLCRASAPSQGIRRDLNYLGASKSLRGLKFLNSTRDTYPGMIANSPTLFGSLAEICCFLLWRWASQADQPLSKKTAPEPKNATEMTLDTMTGQERFRNVGWNCSIPQDQVQCAESRQQVSSWWWKYVGFLPKTYHPNGRWVGPRLLNSPDNSNTISEKQPSLLKKAADFSSLLWGHIILL